MFLVIKQTITFKGNINHPLGFVGCNEMMEIRTFKAARTESGPLLCPFPREPTGSPEKMGLRGWNLSWTMLT